MEIVNDKFYNWASILEWDTREQARKTASMPFIYPRLALMPDAHLGKGATVGSVIPTLGAIMPAAVGVDIGCGMMAIKTQFKREEVPNGLEKLHATISAAIPLSAGNYNTAVTTTARKYINTLYSYNGGQGGKNADAISPNWSKQLGSLGSGNHFIEISTDEDDYVWLFLHSGSRGVGNRLAQKHIKVSQNLCKNVSLPDKDLAYLLEEQEEFWHYITDLQWAQEFARFNRKEMMNRVQEAFEEHMGTAVKAQESVNCHHNYTERTQAEDGTDIWLSRKGAIAAYEGTPGLIPGSMGDKSYVVSGLGNPDAMWSAPHGAGRVYSRSKAKSTFTREDLDAKMEGIVWGNSNAFLDEHPQAYKAIGTVMEDAKDLVKIEHTLKQFLNVKGN